jgi:dihydroorotase
MTDRLTIRMPDDWHLHVRDNDMMRKALPYTATHFGRAIMMPNLVPPVATTADGKAYRDRLNAARPEGSQFKPLITCYLTDDTDPDDVERGFKEGVFTAVKLYPANATTNSAAGVTDFKRIRPVLERMQKIGMPFLLHAESVDPAVPNCASCMNTCRARPAAISCARMQGRWAARSRRIILNSTVPIGSAGATSRICIACR